MGRNGFELTLITSIFAYSIIFGPHAIVGCHSLIISSTFVDALAKTVAGCKAAGQATTVIIVSPACILVYNINGVWLMLRIRIRYILLSGMDVSPILTQPYRVRQFFLPLLIRIYMIRCCCSVEHFWTKTWHRRFRFCCYGSDEPDFCVCVYWVRPRHRHRHRFRGIRRIICDTRTGPSSCRIWHFCRSPVGRTSYLWRVRQLRSRTRPRWIRGLIRLMKISGRR